MKKVIYCSDKPLPKLKNILPLVCEPISRVIDIHKKHSKTIIAAESFLKKRPNFKLPRSNSKIGLIHFFKESKNNLKLARKYGFFDYFTNSDSKADVLFKLKRAGDFLEARTHLLSLKKDISEKNKRIEKITLVDPLTGCFNWRYFLNRIRQELERSRRHGHDISLIGIDIDYFRKINEVYGVAVADLVIKKLAVLLRTLLRKEDTLARWREDEFCIIAPHLGSKDAHDVAKRIKDKIARHKFKYKDISLNIKVCIGVLSSLEGRIFNTRDAISSLERCLSHAKRGGGNSIVLFSRIKPPRKLKHKKEVKVGALRLRIEKMNALLTRDLLEMIYGFARTIEAKDLYTGHHVGHTSDIAGKIARSLKLPTDEIKNIEQAAVLHDLGKVGIDESILSKKGSLNDKEREIIKTHPSIAAEILGEIHALRGAIPAILYHHERFDGKGYPLGISGEEIPLSARIVAVADVYQALVSNRPYRKAYSKSKAMRIIKQESGKHFDPKIVKAFFDVIKKIDTP